MLIANYVDKINDLGILLVSKAANKDNQMQKPGTLLQVKPVPFNDVT